MSAAGLNCVGTLDPIFRKNDIKTKFWSLTCETGLKYNHRVKKKYCITQAVLDPESDKRDVENKFVCVMVRHDEAEHIMAVLKHNEIYQVNLNMLFDRENVTFLLKGTGVVYLLGYEVIEPDFESSFTSTPFRAVQDKESEDTVSEEGEEEDDDDVEEDKSDIEELEAENNGLETEEEESEDSSPPEPVRKRKKKFDDGKSLKRSKMETPLSGASPKQKAAATVTFDGSSNDSSGCLPVKKVKEKSRNEKKVKEVEEKSRNWTLDATCIPIEKKDKKKKKKPKTSFKLDKIQQTMSNQKTAEKGFVTLEGGVEIRDLEIGHGPRAIKGKMVHVFYVGRLFNKEIFDSMLPPGQKPYSFKLGANKEMKGWDIGLEGMKVGGKRKLKVPPSMGFGKNHMKGVPPNSTLYYTIQLQAVG